MLDDGTNCPRLPQPFWSAAGSNFGSYHSCPRGRPVHVSINDTTAIDLAVEHRNVSGHSDNGGMAVVNERGTPRPEPKTAIQSALAIHQNLIIDAPLWHDWAKTIASQWNAGGTEFAS